MTDKLLIADVNAVLSKHYDTAYGAASVENCAAIRAQPLSPGYAGRRLKHEAGLRTQTSVGHILAGNTCKQRM